MLHLTKASFLFVLKWVSFTRFYYLADYKPVFDSHSIGRIFTDHHSHHSQNQWIMGKEQQLSISKSKDGSAQTLQILVVFFFPYIGTIFEIQDTTYRELFIHPGIDRVGIDFFCCKCCSHLPLQGFLWKLLWLYSTQRFSVRVVLICWWGDQNRWSGSLSACWNWIPSVRAYSVCIIDKSGPKILILIVQDGKHVSSCFFWDLFVLKDMSFRPVPFTKSFYPLILKVHVI